MYNSLAGIPQMYPTVSHWPLEKEGNTEEKRNGIGGGKVDDACFLCHLSPQGSPNGDRMIRVTLSEGHAGQHGVNK